MRDTSFLVWLALFAATFYLSRSAYRPFPATLTAAWVGLAASVASPVLLPLIRLDLEVLWIPALSAAALAVTVVSLMLYFQDTAKLKPRNPPAE